MENYAELLSRVSLFEGIAKEEMETVLHCLGAREAAYPRGAFIRMEGDAADFIGILLSGAVQIVREDCFGCRDIVASIEPGGMFGEAFACAGAGSIPVSVLAAEDATVLMLSKDRLLSRDGDGCAYHACLIRNLLRIVAEKNLMLSRKMGYMAKRRTSEKLMAYLKDQAKENRSTDFTIPFDRQGLADYLGVDRSAMSLEISRLQKQGKLRTSRSRFELLGE